MLLFFMDCWGFVGCFVTNLNFLVGFLKAQRNLFNGLRDGNLKGSGERPAWCVLIDDSIDVAGKSLQQNIKIAIDFCHGNFSLYGSYMLKFLPKYFRNFT